MATIIEQEPLYTTLPVGQQIIFTLSNSLVSSYFNVKFIAEVFIGSTPPNVAVTTDLIGTFKTTPNTIGVGIFDFSSVVENHVKSDNLCARNSQYKITSFTTEPFPALHIIDGFSWNTNALSYMTIKFKIEGSLTQEGIPEIIDSQDTSSTNFEIFNGYLKHTDKLRIFGNNFGYNTTNFQPTATFPVANTKSLLTNAPMTQYANIEDYGTIAFLNQNMETDYVDFKYYNSSDVLISTDQVYSFWSLSSLFQSYTQADARLRLMYCGCYPANLTNWSANFAAAIGSDLSYYTVTPKDTSNLPLTKTLTININCPDLKGYESIRLAWLNQWGAWDYYTFTKKSSHTVSTKGSTYTQLEGTWNEKAFKLDGFRGGKKAFRVNATEKIRMNTDFVSEADGEWFEELINSPEVYLLEGFQTDPTLSMLNTYVTPVRLTTSSYTRKTVANDKLMQYTFEVEKSKTFRTQAI